MAYNSSYTLSSNVSSGNLYEKQTKHAREKPKSIKVVCNEMVCPGCSENEKLKETISLLNKKNSELEKKNLELKKILKNKINAKKKRIKRYTI